MVLILYMALIIPGGILVNALIDEKKNRVMEVLMTSVSPAQMVTGKVAALGLLGLLMTALWLGVLWAVARFGGQALSIPAGFSIPTGLLAWALIYFLGGYAIYGAQFAGIGALAPDVNQTKSVTWIVMLPIIVAYMFMALSFDNPTGPLAVFLSLFPLTSSVAMIGRMAATEVPLWQAVLAAVLQFVTAYFIIRLTARMFRAQYLLTGQAFSPKMYYQVLFGRA
jgi:ABC-2 type transport system permease protein